MPSEIRNQQCHPLVIGLDWIGTHDFEMCALRLIGCFQTMRVHVRINCKHILIGNLLETASAAFLAAAKSRPDLGITSDRVASETHKSYLSETHICRHLASRHHQYPTVGL